MCLYGGAKKQRLGGFWVGYASALGRPGRRTGCVVIYLQSARRHSPIRGEEDILP